MKNNIFTIMKKELRRVFFDRKLAVAVFLMPGLTIAIMYSLMGGMIQKMGDDASEHVAIVRTIDAPEQFIETASLIFPDEMDIKQSKATDVEDSLAELEEGNVDALLIFEGDFTQDSEKLPVIKKYTNSIKDFSVSAGYMVDAVIDSMKTAVLAEKLGDVEKTRVFDITNSDVAKAEEKAGKAIGMLLPMLLTVFLFAGAMQVGMDTIAGEKERGTLSTMLLTPVNRRDIALGKMISLSIVSLASCLSSLAGVILSLPFSNTIFGGGFSISDLTYGAPEFLLLIMQMLFLSLSFVSIICLLSTLARNIKEAGGYIAPAYMVILVISLSTIFGSPEGSWGYFIPMYGNIISIKNILTFEYSPLNGLFAVIATLIFAAVMTLLMVRAFRSERMMKSA